MSANLEQVYEMTTVASGAGGTEQEGEGFQWSFTGLITSLAEFVEYIRVNSRRNLSMQILCYVPKCNRLLIANGDDDSIWAGRKYCQLRNQCRYSNVSIPFLSSCTIKKASRVSTSRTRCSSGWNSFDVNSSKYESCGFYYVNPTQNRNLFILQPKSIPLKNILDVYLRGNSDHVEILPIS